MPKRKSRTARKNKTKVQKSVAKKSITTFKASGEPNVEDVLNHAEGATTAVARNEDMEMDSAMDASASQLEILQVPQSCFSGGSLPSEPSHRTGPKKGPKKGKKVVEKSDERIHIECNELGQPIGPDSVHYSSYLGAVARVVGPITVSTWHKVPQHLKEKMWTMVKKKFIVSEQAKKLALKTLGKCWREYKGKLRKNFYDIHENDEERIANCPRHVKREEWKIFVANTSKPDYKEQRIKLKKTREHHSLPHTCSRKGYARLGDEMKRNSDDPSSITRGDVWAMAHRKKNGEPINDLVKEKIDKLTETSSSIPYGKDDKLSQVLGTDPNGRVRGMGFGVTQSTLFCVQQNYARFHELEDELRTLRQKMSSMEAKLVKLESQQNESVNELHVEVLEEHRNLTVQNYEM